MRTKYLAAIIVTILVMAFLFFRDRSENPMTSSEPAMENKSATTKVAASSEADKLIDAQATESKSGKEKAAAGLSDEQNIEIQKTFSNNIKLLGACLSVQPQVDADKITPTFENLSSSLKTALGEVVVRMDDWTQQDLKYSDGTTKRIRTEIEYQDNGSPVRRAQLYKVNEQGMPELQPLNQAQAVEPTDDFLNSLKADGQEILEEKGSRVYYQEGEELVLVERGGKVQSFSLTKGEKTFSCTETDAATSNCQCL